MNREDVITFINEPGRLDQSTLTDVGDLMESFPYFQTAHLLKVKNLHNINSLEFNNALRYSSAFIGDRAILYHLIHNEIVDEKEPVDQVGAAEEDQLNSTEINTAKTVREQEKSADFSEEEQVGSTEGQPAQKDQAPEPEDQPLAALKPETDSTIHTFTGWFDHLPDSTVATSAQAGSENDLIDNFIRNQPRIERNQEELPEQQDISEAYVQSSDQFMTETLAKIYVDQGKAAKAIHIYEKLSLKYPEKSSYFASQIRIISHNLDK